MKNIIKYLFVALPFGAVFASSHREAPLIANDPLADNTDLYAFKSPNDPNSITIIANYVPLQVPHGGPNYYSFGENIRYEIHIDNDASAGNEGDEIIYRFTFTKTNQDPTTFFDIRLGAENNRVSYLMERSIDGGTTFQSVITNGMVPPPNIGPRSIESFVGLDSNYQDMFDGAMETTGLNEKVFCGSIDDPFFVDLGGIFDLGDAPRQTSGTPTDALECLNVSTIALQIPITVLQKTGLPVSSAANILDGDFVIGVWASASRQQTNTLNATGGGSTNAGSWVQVSRLGMPLTNEAVIPIGQKDFWNSLTPYQELADATLDENFYNPELALYMDDALFGGAVPAFAPLRIQTNSRPDITGTGFDFSNGGNGLYPLKGSAAVAGTALDDAIAGTLLLPAPNKPRSVDLWPIFHTGVPNLAPYHLSEGKAVDGNGNVNPLSAGKPFINNFLPNGGDMLRLNMAVPATPRNSPAFSSLGLIQAAALGLTDPTYSGIGLEFIPNMDGFPNGRRLEDDVTRIELQAVGGAVLAAIGMYYDDYNATTGPILTPNGVTGDFGNVLGYSTGVESNDEPFMATFPYVAMPHRGTDNCLGMPYTYTQPTVLGPTSGVNELAANENAYSIKSFPNPFSNTISFEYNLDSDAKVEIKLFTVGGQMVSTLMNNEKQNAGKHTNSFNTANLNSGVYFARVSISGSKGKAVKLIKIIKS